MYEQMEFDVTLEGERELRENIDVAVSFACRQLQQSEPTKVTNKHEGYGIAAEAYSALAGSMKKVQGDMKTFLGILPADDSAAINTANSLYNSAVEVVYQATLLAAQANRVMTDIYEAHKDDKTPLEEYAESRQEDMDGFEETQEDDDDSEEDDSEDEDDGEEQKPYKRGCITGFSRYPDLCSCCGYGGAKCCGQCTIKKNCNSRCGWFGKAYRPEKEVANE